eukprot:TRINITY_DN8530_c0_g1_i1.p1 TRINITY_DN8530_c0_g1~~TRINITY_DN8530_c0_g1_i1.p1  ORF type:complete len:306 (-),score=97.50 TRINITY_DN8530_c0_g1_i1:21-938(-)
MGGPEAPRRPSRTEDLTHDLALTLEDFYNGVSKMLEYTRDELCGTCDGRGTKSPSISKKCGTCNGTGQQKITQRFGGGLFQTVQRCGSCNGTGEKIKPEDACGTCRGHGTVQKEKVLKIEIEPGTRPGTDKIFYGESNQYPGASTGDVVITLTEKPHYLFTRSEDDLYMKKKISLNEALTGYEFTFRHLDGKMVTVKSSVDSKVISPGDVQMLAGEGMPGKFKKGNLYIQFSVDFPKDKLLSEEETLAKLGVKNKAEPANTVMEAVATNHKFVDESRSQKESAGGYKKYKRKRAQQQQEQSCNQM